MKSINVIAIIALFLIATTFVSATFSNLKGACAQDGLNCDSKKPNCCSSSMTCQNKKKKYDRYDNWRCVAAVAAASPAKKKK
jgi:hypothetical protein